MRLAFYFCLISILTRNANAFLIDLNLNYFQGTFSQATKQTNFSAINSIGLFADLKKTGSGAGLYIGWSISMLSQKEVSPPDLDQNLSSNDMGPSVRWQIDKRRLFSLTTVYNIICKGSLNDGSTNKILNGESYLVKLAIEPAINETLYVGVAVNYYGAFYKTLTVSSNQTTINYNNTWFYPSISLSYRY